MPLTVIHINMPFAIFLVFISNIWNCTIVFPYNSMTFEFTEKLTGSMAYKT